MIAQMEEIFRGEFTTDVLETTVLNHKRMVVRIRPAALLEIVNFLTEDKRYRFIIASGISHADHFEILYHLSDDSTGYILSLQVELLAEKPEIESLANLVPAANWIEREIHDLFGITFLNHPNMVPLIANGNWAADEHPYATQGRRGAVAESHEQGSATHQKGDSRLRNINKDL